MVAHQAVPERGRLVPLVRPLRTAGSVWWRRDVDDSPRLTAEDQKRGFNRTELLSPIPASAGDFKRLAWLRNDAESNNSALEGKLFNKRAHSVGHLSQRANLLGYALLVNALTLYLAKRRGGVRGGPPPPGAIAA
jgi:hypothetical protein